MFPFECNEVFFAMTRVVVAAFFEKNKNEPLSSEGSREILNEASVNYDVCLHHVTKVRNFYFW